MVTARCFSTQCIKKYLLKHHEEYKENKKQIDHYGKLKNTWSLKTAERAKYRALESEYNMKQYAIFTNHAVGGGAILELEKYSVECESCGWALYWGNKYD